jgi:hypothetical protein
VAVTCTVLSNTGSMCCAALSSCVLRNYSRSLYGVLPQGHKLTCLSKCVHRVLWSMFVLVFLVLPLCRATGAKACIDRFVFRLIRETVHSYRATQVGTGARAPYTHVDKDGLRSV